MAIFFCKNGLAQDGVYPIDSSVFENSTILFEWNTNTDAIDYNIEIASDPLFSSLVYSQTNIVSNTQVVNIVSGYGDYYWRVHANLIGGGQLGSAVKKFTLYIPSETNNMSLWLSADSVQIAGDTVTQWYDQSTNLYHAKQSNLSKQPKLISSSSEINNQPTIQFDGSNDFLQIGDSLDLDSNDLCAFVVGKANANPAIFIAKSESGDNNGTYSIRYQGGAGSLEFRYGDGTNRPIIASKPHGSYEIFNIHTDRNNGFNKLFVNSQDMGTATGVQDSTYNFNSSHVFRIGASAFSNGNTFAHLNGEIAEIIIYFESLNDSTRYLIEQYLRYKYAPPVNLGADLIVPYGFCDTTLSAGNRFTSFLWNTGDTTETITVSSQGTYSVSVTDIFGYTSVDTIKVLYPDPTNIEVTDTTICLGDMVTISSYLDHQSHDFLWSDSSTDSLLNISTPGDYWVRVTDTTGCFLFSDTVTVAVDSFSVQSSLGPNKLGCQGEKLNLISGSNIATYLWSTTDTTAQTTIDTTGNYWVQVTNNIGCVAYDTILITVNGQAPNVNFSTQNTCDNSISIFNNGSFTTDGSNIISSLWEFGNGDTSSIFNPQYPYTSSGTYNVTLEINTDSGCTNTLIQQVVIHEKPTAGFFPANSLICSGQAMLFNSNSFTTDGIIDTWSWDFGDTGTADTSSFENASYSYSSSGSFNVVYIVTTEYGCSDTSSQFISVKQSPVASYSSTGNCVNNQVAFTNTSSGSIFSSDWSFGDANSSTLLNPVHIYADSGTYAVDLIIRDLNGCYDTLQSQLAINHNPVADFVTNDYCVLSNIQLYDSSLTISGSLTGWEWNVENNSNQSVNQNPIFFFNQADSGIYQLKLKVTNSFGCIDSVEKTIVVYSLPTPDFNFSPTIGLPPLAVTFDNQTVGGDTYHWNYGNGDTSVVISPTYTYQDSGVFDITLIATSIYGCTDSIIKSIQVVEPTLDVAVKDITYEFVSGSNFMKITVQLANYGLIEIQNMDLILTTSSNGTILEKWVGNLPSLNQELYTFSSIIELARGEIPDVVCVEALSPNNGIDKDYSNNEFCKALDKFELINLYPNPVSQNINVEYIVPADGELEIWLFDEIGNKVKNLYSGISSKGLNTHIFNLGIFANGIYVIEINSQGETIRKKVMIN